MPGYRLRFALGFGAGAAAVGRIGPRAVAHEPARAEAGAAASVAIGSVMTNMLETFSPDSCAAVSGLARDVEEAVAAARIDLGGRREQARRPLALPERRPRRTASVDCGSTGASARHRLHSFVRRRRRISAWGRRGFSSALRRSRPASARSTAGAAEAGVAGSADASICSRALGRRRPAITLRRRCVGPQPLLLAAQQPGLAAPEQDLFPRQHRERGGIGVAVLGIVDLAGPGRRRARGQCR